MLITVSYSPLSQLYPQPKKQTNVPATPLMLISDCQMKHGAGNMGRPQKPKLESRIQRTHHP